MHDAPCQQPSTLVEHLITSCGKARSARTSLNCSQFEVFRRQSLQPLALHKAKASMCTEHAFFVELLRHNVVKASSMIQS